MGFWSSQRKGYGARKAGARSARDYAQRGVQDTTAGALAGGAGMDMLAQQYAGIISGQQPSLAEMQMREAYGQAMGGTQAMVAGASGANRALTQRAAMQERGRLSGELARGGAQMRMQEQELARQGLMGVAGTQQQHALSLEDLMMQKYGVEMGMLSPQQEGMGAKLLGATIGAAGSVVGGALAGGG